jgi:hypothetical protein
LEARLDERERERNGGFWAETMAPTAIHGQRHGFEDARFVLEAWKALFLRCMYDTRRPYKTYNIHERAWDDGRKNEKSTSTLLENEFAEQKDYV